MMALREAASEACTVECAAAHALIILKKTAAKTDVGALFVESDIGMT